MIDQLIAKYIALRDKKTTMKRAYDAKVAAIDEGLDTIERLLHTHLTENGVDRLGSKEGVAFFSTERSATVADHDAFFNYLRESDNWHLADIRASKKQIGEFRDEFDDLPPGINWRESKVVRVNRA